MSYFEFQTSGFSNFGKSELLPSPVHTRSIAIYIDLCCQFFISVSKSNFGLKFEIAAQSRRSGRTLHAEFKSVFRLLFLSVRYTDRTNEQKTNVLRKIKNCRSVSNLLELHLLLMCIILRSSVGTLLHNNNIILSLP